MAGDRRLSTVADAIELPIRNGVSPIEVPEWTGVQMLGLGCLTENGFEPRQLKNAPPSVRTDHPAILQGGDVLVSRSNTRELVGLSGRFIDIGTPCIYPDLMMRLKPANNCRSEYLEAVLRSSCVRREIKASAQGTSGSMVKISARSLMKIRIPLPSLDEQDRIIEAMESASAAETGTERTIAKLRVTRAAMINGLPRDLKEHITLSDVLVGLPQNGLYKPESSYGAMGTPIVRIDSYSEGHSGLRQKLRRVEVTCGERDNYGLADDDILINRVNTIEIVGKSTRVAGLREPTVFESNIMRCKANRGRFRSAFIEAWLSTHTAKSHLRSRAKSAISQASINQQDVLTCPIPDVDLDQQDSFLRELGALDTRIAAEQAHLAKIRRIKQGLMDDLLSGRASVADLG